MGPFAPTAFTRLANNRHANPKAMKNTRVRFEVVFEDEWRAKLADMLAK
jgi:hypothetical protein